MENIESNGTEKEIDPYLEIITDNKQTDKYTGLYLNDIWRFFRHNWSLPYKTSVGRTLLFLLRNFFLNPQIPHSALFVTKKKRASSIGRIPNN